MAEGEKLGGSRDLEPENVDFDLEDFFKDLSVWINTLSRDFFSQVPKDADEVEEALRSLPSGVSIDSDMIDDELIEKGASLKLQSVLSFLAQTGRQGKDSTVTSLNVWMRNKSPRLEIRKNTDGSVEFTHHLDADSSL